MKLLIVGLLSAALLSTTSTSAFASVDYLGKYLCPMGTKSFLLINFSDYGTKFGPSVGRDITVINGLMGNENLGPYTVSNPNTEVGFDWVFTNEAKQEVARVIVDQNTGETVVRIDDELDVHVQASTYPCYMIEKDMIMQGY